MLELIKTIAVTTIDPEVKNTNLPEIAAQGGAIEQVLQIVIAITAALSVLFIVVGGLRYVLADGDPQNAAKARSTIIYALIGLIIAVAAEAIVAFVVKRL